MWINIEYDSNISVDALSTHFLEVFPCKIKSTMEANQRLFLCVVLFGCMHGLFAIHNLCN